MWATDLAQIGKGDVVFVVSIEPYGDRPVRAARLARDAGATVIAITDAQDAPFVSLASICFVVETQSPQFFPSHVVPLLLIEGLMGMVVRRAGKKAAGSIRLTEATGHQMKEYWVDEPD